MLKAKKKKPRGTRKSDLINNRKSTLYMKFVFYSKRLGFSTAIIVGLLWLGLWFVWGGYAQNFANKSYDKFIEISSKSGFVINDIIIEGRVNVDLDIINAIVNTNKGDSIIEFDPDYVQQTLSKISWVKDVKVQRQLPDIILIKLEEKVPVALWKNGDNLMVIDINGSIVDSRSMDRFKDFIILTGELAPINAPELIGILKSEMEIYNNIESASWVSNRRWNLNTKAGIKIKLPENNIGYALTRLAKSQKDEKILEKDITIIDLRLSDRMIVRTRPGSVLEYKASFNKSNPI